MLLNDTRTDRLQLTQQQREELTAHVKKWADIDGDYEATMLGGIWHYSCLLYTSPSPRDATLSRMPSSA